MMRTLLVAVISAVTTLGAVQLHSGSPQLAAAKAPVVDRQEQTDICVFFSPNGGCTEAIVKELNAAKKSIDVQAYSFTSAPIADAVAKAHARGVAVRVILDKSQQTAQYSSLTYLRNHNVPTWVDSKHAIAHNKIILVDGQTLITGSFNFSKAAEEKNAENLLVIRNNPNLLAEYRENFAHHLEHAKQ